MICCYLIDTDEVLTMTMHLFISSYFAIGLPKRKRFGGLQGEVDNSTPGNARLSRHFDEKELYSETC